MSEMAIFFGRGKGNNDSVILITAFCGRAVYKMLSWRAGYATGKTYAV
jgi:hypothetical protein